MLEVQEHHLIIISRRILKLSLSLLCLWNRPEFPPLWFQFPPFVRRTSVHTLNKNINTLIFAPIFHELNSKVWNFFYIHKRSISLKYWSQMCQWALLCWAPPHRCVIATCWLDSRHRWVQVCLRKKLWDVQVCFIGGSENQPGPPSHRADQVIDRVHSLKRSRPICGFSG